MIKGSSRALEYHIFFHGERKGKGATSQIYIEMIGRQKVHECN
jgi:hypothetical protein